jgi:hypothetical protein
MLQLLGKLILTIALLGSAAVLFAATIRVWRGDISTEWLNPLTRFRQEVQRRTEAFVREQDAIYQGEKIVARVRGPVTIDADRRVVRFTMIFRAETFDIHTPFTYGAYRLRLKGNPDVDAGTNFTESGEATGRTLEGVTCDITGSG